MKAPVTISRSAGFTLVEALVTIAILGIMSSVLITAFSNASTDSSRMISRSQQASLQAALNAWINGDGNRVNTINATTGTGKMKTLEEIRTVYNGATHSKARLALVGGYLDTSTFDHLNNSTVNTGKIKSEALSATKQYLEMPDWASGSYPQVLLKAE
jgi:prepilin-type N-terminal cleavage/methylation domain-containing protein